jgi:hypothetical protein
MQLSDPGLQFQWQGRLPPQQCTGAVSSCVKNSRHEKACDVLSDCHRCYSSNDMCLSCCWLQEDPDGPETAVSAMIDLSQINGATQPGADTSAVSSTAKVLVKPEVLAPVGGWPQVRLPFDASHWECSQCNLGCRLQLTVRACCP